MEPPAMSLNVVFENNLGPVFSMVDYASFLT